FRWVHHSFGTNWRMLEMQAAIGRVQLRRMSQWSATRQHHAALISQAVQQHDVVRDPMPGADIEHAAYKKYLFVRQEELGAGWSRDRIIDAINARGVPCQQGTCSEVYLEKAFETSAFRPASRLPVASELGETSLMFLVHPTLTTAEMEKTCSVISEVLATAGRASAMA